MSMTNQEILDHTARYLFDRIQNKGGRLVKGWYNKRNGDHTDRCVLGTLAGKDCIGVEQISKAACNKLNGYSGPFVPSGKDFPEIALTIMHWNDHLSQLPITVNEAQMMLKNLALSFSLSLTVWNSLMANKDNKPQDQEGAIEEEYTHEEETECA